LIEDTPWRHGLHLEELAGTFPSFAPVSDIDHIWVRRDRLPDLHDRSFTNFAFDDRGQVARLRLTPPGPATRP